MTSRSQRPDRLFQWEYIFAKATISDCLYDMRNLKNRIKVRKICQTRVKGIMFTMQGGFGASAVRRAYTCILSAWTDCHHRVSQ